MTSLVTDIIKYRLNPSLASRQIIAQRALYRLGPRGKLWPGSESLEIERARPREYALPS